MQFHNIQWVDFIGDLCVPIGLIVGIVIIYGLAKIYQALRKIHNVLVLIYKKS